MQEQTSATVTGLLDAERLLESLFPNEQTRPSVRWLRDQQKRKTIPYIKVSRLVFFDPVAVRTALTTRHTVQPARR